MDLSNLFLPGLPMDCKRFKQLLDSQSLVDCTLACDGGKVSAHKVVLSACSSYLAKILIEHPVEHPIIILPELSIEDVRTLVHYMYTGELLKSNTLHSINLLRTAAILSINSLNDFLNGSTTSTTNNNNQSLANLTTSLSTTSSSSSNSNSNNISYNNLSANEYFNGSQTDSETYANGTQTDSAKNYINIMDARTSDYHFNCPHCHNDFQTICSFEYHMQRIHNVTSFGCEICHKPFASLRYVLTDHMRRCHGWKPEQKLPQC